MIRHGGDDDAAYDNDVAMDSDGMASESDDEEEEEEGSDSD